jgi:hypothetical protein
MFAPLLAKAQRRATANPVSEMMRQSSTLAARSFGCDLGSEVTPMERAARGATRSLAWDFSKIQVFSTNGSRQRIPMQPKLIIGPATDPIEHEADNVVMSRASLNLTAAAAVRIATQPPQLRQAWKRLLAMRA